LVGAYRHWVVFCDGNLGLFGRGRESSVSRPRRQMPARIISARPRMTAAIDVIHLVALVIALPLPFACHLLSKKL
jgi:hypothetical protein